MQNPTTANVGVYLLRAPDGLFKIGHSNDIGKRVSNLACGVQSGLKIVDTFAVAGKSQRIYTEKCLHALLVEYYVSREWYRLPEDLEAWKTAVDTVRERSDVFAFWNELGKGRSLPCLMRAKGRGIQWEGVKPRGRRKREAVPSCPAKGLCITREAHRKARVWLFERLTGILTP